MMKYQIYFHFFFNFHSKQNENSRQYKILNNFHPTEFSIQEKKKKKINASKIKFINQYI